MQGRKARGGWNHCYVDGDVLGNRTSVKGTVHGLLPWNFLSPLYNMNSLLSIHSPCDAVWNILSCLWTRTWGPFSCVRLFGCWRGLACIRQLFPRKHHPRFTLFFTVSFRFYSQTRRTETQNSSPTIPVPRSPLQLSFACCFSQLLLQHLLFPWRQTLPWAPFLLLYITFLLMSPPRVAHPSYWLG